MSLVTKFQDSFATLLFATPQPPMLDICKCRLVDLPRFGKHEAENDPHFRWPTENDLLDLNLEAPPKLIGVKSSGSASGLASLQLLFENGIKSPVFDSQR